MVSPEPIAIIGSACRFPGGSDSPSKLWDLLKEPRDLLQKVPEKRRWHPESFYHKDPEHHGTSNVSSSYFLDDDPASFDNTFFNIQPSECEAIDPQQRMLMETVYDSVSAAGQTIDGLRGSSTAVYVGMMCDDWSAILTKDAESIPQYSATGMGRSIMSNRISYFFDWHGPSLTLDTACSSSLVAVHLAVQALRNGECGTAVAAGVNLCLSPGMYIATSNLHMLSAESRSRMWDKDVDGYARGEGIASVVLKPLSAAIRDGDHIECLIRATGVNQDGKTQGLTMPSATAQTALIRQTYERAGLNIDRPEDRPQFFHAHGTGTPAGDPQEAEAISTAFYSGGASDKLYVGSIKTVIGHTEGTAGLASLIGTSLALQHGIIPPNLLFNELNPRLVPFYQNLEVPTSAKPWPQLLPGQTRRASVNSFGFGGTNAHAIIEAYENPTPSLSANGLFSPLVFSAATEKSLRASLSAHADYLQANPQVPLRNFAHTLQERRSTLAYRAVISASNVTDAVQRIKVLLEDADSVELSTKHFATPQPRLLGVFTGQGAQWPRMGARIVESSPFASKKLDELDAALATLPADVRPVWTLREEMLADMEVSKVAEAAISQPLCTAVQVLLVDLLTAAGIKFDAVVGHSSGEIGAAYAAGFISAETAICVAYLRGFYAKLAGAGDIKGSMMAVGTSYEDALEFCELEHFSGRISVAAVNSASSITLSGDKDAIAEAVEIFKDEGKFARQLKVDTAYHSVHMLPCSEPYLAAMDSFAKSIEFSNDCAGARPTWYSSVFNGAVMDPADLNSEYWVSNMVKPVMFSAAVAAAVTGTGPFNLALEVGPHPALKGPCLDTLAEALGDPIPYSGLLARSKNDVLELSTALGFVWSNLGASSVRFDDFEKLFSGIPDSPQPVANLPKYVFDHTRSFWQISRASGAQFLARDPPHPILGKRSLERETSQHVEWRNILSPKELPWLQGHRIQGGMVFPAAGYVAMVIEAMKIVVGKSRMSLIHIENLYIGKAMAFNQETSTMESLFRINIVHSTSDGLRAEFSCCSGAPYETGTTMGLNAEGIVTVTLSEPEPDAIPYMKPKSFDMTEIEIDRFYTQIHKLGYEYSAPFRGLLSIQRKNAHAMGILEDQGGSEWEDQLLVHPGMLDTAIQSSSAAFGCPGDGMMWTLYIPTGIQSIIINPYYTPYATEKQQVLPWETLSHGMVNTRTSMDINIFSEDNEHTFIQVEGLELMPFTAARPEDDANIFSSLQYRVDRPSGDLAVLNDGWDSHSSEAATKGERVSFFYLRRLLEEITPEEKTKTLPHYQHLLNWAAHVVARVKAGKNPSVPPSCMSDTQEIIDSMWDGVRNRADIRLIESVGRHLIQVVREGSGILEHMDGLFDFYDKGLGLDRANRHLARMVKQLSHRYPHMNIFEIGAGTGGSTRNIISAIREEFSTYTYTDVSSGFFEAAQELFQDYEDQMIYSTYNMEHDPTSQGFEEGHYDLVLASNVLHATDKLEEMMMGARKLLKPGGYLIALELTNNDSMRVGLPMGTLPGWWVGAENGRPWGPTVTLPQWDSLLRKCGFSGIDTSTPIQHRLQASTIFAAQAVNDSISVLRSPLTAINNLPMTDAPRLVIIVERALRLTPLPTTSASLLASRYSEIVRVVFIR